MYTDEQRQKIAEEEYEDYDVGDKVTVGSGSGKIVVGYVSGVEDTGSGFKAYTVTDIKLPKNPTQKDLDRVGYVTMLYQGSTGIDKTLNQPGAVLLDWVVNG